MIAMTKMMSDQELYILVHTLRSGVSVFRFRFATDMYVVYVFLCLQYQRRLIQSLLPRVTLSSRNTN